MANVTEVILGSAIIINDGRSSPGLRFWEMFLDKNNVETKI